MTTKPPILLRKETYRLWFEFYKLALASTDNRVVSALKGSADYYKAWGDVRSIKFDAWWQTHQDLFSEVKTKSLTTFDDRQTLDSLLIEVPLNQSISRLLGDIKAILIDAQRRLKPNYRKKKTTFTKGYQLTKGAEPKLETIRSLLNIYRDVYLPNNKPKFTKTLDLVDVYFKSKNKTIPNSLVFDQNQGGKENARKNLSRWMTWAELIVLNVANGQFPGKY